MMFMEIRESDPKIEDWRIMHVESLDVYQGN